jgi:hypothetical protein
MSEELISRVDYCLHHSLGVDPNAPYWRALRADFWATRHQSQSVSEESHRRSRRIQNILWRLEHGELDGVRPKVIVVLAGTNNVGSEPGGDEKIPDITRGLKALVELCQRKAPAATIVLTAIFPRNDNMAVLPEIEQGARANTGLGGALRRSVAAVVPDLRSTRSSPSHSKPRPQDRRPRSPPASEHKSLSGNTHSRCRRREASRLCPGTDRR